jgi:hypothetical protein
MPTFLRHSPTSLADTDVVVSPEAIGLNRLILAQGPRVRDVAASFHRIGQERVAVRVADGLHLWDERGLVRLEDPARIATQFLEVVRGELYFFRRPGRDLSAARRRESTVRFYEWRHDALALTPAQRRDSGLRESGGDCFEALH